MSTQNKLYRLRRKHCQENGACYLDKDAFEVTLCTLHAEAATGGNMVLPLTDSVHPCSLCEHNRKYSAACHVPRVESEAIRHRGEKDAHFADNYGGVVCRLPTVTTRKVTT